MIVIKQGSVFLIRFTFTTQEGFKQRPAVIISSTAYHKTHKDVIFMPITGQNFIGFDDLNLSI